MDVHLSSRFSLVLVYNIPNCKLLRAAHDGRRDREERSKGFLDPQKEKASAKPRLKVWEETWSERNYQQGSFRRKIILVY
jgi:hypothetical protein